MLVNGGTTSILEDVQNIIRGPSMNATSHTHMYECGRHFRTWTTDHMKVTTMNSGIFMLTRSGDVEVPYCGIINDILEVDFRSFTIVLMDVQWHKSIMPPSRRPSMVLDECGFYRVDTRLSVPQGTEYSDTIVLPSQVDQCIMVPM